jgi:hypothetical protein
MPDGNALRHQPRSVVRMSGYFLRAPKVPTPVSRCFMKPRPTLIDKIENGFHFQLPEYIPKAQ